ncbi:LOW QUALITY PROTEIN: hypothetical protein Cgig2_005891 [Carnegiea gigantea]|uniref:Uncharacterized protein n=1 Tax=Carnegiea gigantea TaxID=171969 RepID=A0A9Q1JPX8_9CARY|nr:LOW QUALITY PROTEIN: hypothetical protein Cgig2_005891 [Carnegiea gigantea]
MVHDDAINAVTVSVMGRVYTGLIWVGGHTMVDTLGKHSSTANALALSKDGNVWSSWRGRQEGGEAGRDGPVLCFISLVAHDLFLSSSAERRSWCGEESGGWGSFCCLAVMEGHHITGRDPNDVVSVCGGCLDGEIEIWRVMPSEPVNAHRSVH